LAVLAGFPCSLPHRQFIDVLNNPDFKLIEFDDIRKEAGLNSFALIAREGIENPAQLAVSRSQVVTTHRRVYTQGWCVRCNLVKANDLVGTYFSKEKPDFV